jgi:hypothetical protein
MDASFLVIPQQRCFNSQIARKATRRQHGCGDRAELSDPQEKLDYGLSAGGGFLPLLSTFSVVVEVVVPPGVEVVVLLSFFVSSVQPKGAKRLSPHTTA